MEEAIAIIIITITILISNWRIRKWKKKAATEYFIIGQKAITSDEREWAYCKACKDITRLRVVIYDDNPYINPDCAIYTLPDTPPPEQDTEETTTEDLEALKKLHSDPLGALTEKQRSIYLDLPSVFTTRDGLTTALLHSMSERTFKDWIKTAIFKKLDYGTYEKRYK